MRARVTEAQKYPAVLGQGLVALSRGDDCVDAQAAAQVCAEVLLMIRGALTKRQR